MNDFDWTMSEANEYHVNKAQQAIEVYRSSDPNSSFEEAFRDLLCDMRHLADAQGIDFYQQMGMAYNNYLSEVQA